MPVEVLPKYSKKTITFHLSNKYSNRQEFHQVVQVIARAEKPKANHGRYKTTDLQRYKQVLDGRERLLELMLLKLITQQVLVTGKTVICLSEPFQFFNPSDILPAFNLNLGGGRGR